ncbi:hypothetical protein [Tateyamaria pelophila]|uniref:hypothetical protein n=1 Tax=Tateyamaria pelophila TaxID=328415 RepID=UPI001CBE80B8|nr:hypothetical protein [Tateyamaria pelophila]
MNSAYKTTDCDSFVENWTRLPDVNPRDLNYCITFPQKLASGLPSVALLTDPDELTYALCYEVKPSPETMKHVLADLIAPRLLAHGGHFVLHCGMVGCSEKALGFMGPSGFGKSTMTASLHHRGLTLMSDDAALLREGSQTYHAERLYPSLRLFPDSIDQMFQDIKSTRPVADYTDKRHVAFTPGPTSAPLAALFCLADPADEIRVSRLTYTEACMALIANSFALNPADPPEAKRRFIKATEVASRIPVYNLHYPRDFDALPKVHALIFKTIGLKHLEESTA